MRHPITFLFTTLIAILIAAGCQKSSTAKKEIIVLCGGSMRKPLEALVKQYNETHPDVTVLATYGGSGELMAQLQQTEKGDVYVCHDPFMEWGEQQGVIADWTTLGYLNVVIAVPKGNPEGIESVADLGKPGLRLGMGDKRYSTSGVIVERILAKVPNGAAIAQNVRMETKGHQGRANDVILGSLDATIIWNAVAHLFMDKLDTLPIPDEYIDAVTSATYDKSDLQNVKVTAGLTTYAKSKPHVQAFFAYIRDKGEPIFTANGVTPRAHHEG